MSAETITDALLKAAAPVVSAVDERIALEVLPQGSDYPAIAYQIVSDIGVQYLNEKVSESVARVQINPLAKDPGALLVLHAAVRGAMEGSHKTIAGFRILSCRFEAFGPPSKDSLTGVWTKPADYILIYE
ncbi:MAG: tail completion protein gp17 [Hydrogenophaga sp.]|uniref:tail completion protein gp17 n=1 Tax=Hydrogenophaga sp. TaxID=1904254 RepID=UPI004035BD9C